MNVHTITCFRSLAIIANLSLLVAEGSRAQDTHEWNDPTGGVYGTFVDWTPIGVPAPQDTARFNLDATYKVAFVQSRSVTALQVDDGIVSFDGSGIFGGNADRVYTLGGAAISHGAELILERVNPNRDINLEIDNMLDVIGTLSIHDSSIVDSSSGVVDSFSGSFTALVRVDGTDGGLDRSTWNVDDLTVGVADRGRISISDGGIVNSEFATIGKGNGSFGDVQVRGFGPNGVLSATWTQSSITMPLVLGDQGRGLLTIEEGGLVTSQNVEMGKLFGGVGDVTVRGLAANGSRSTWSTRDLTVGVGGDFGGSGSLQILDGGFVTSGNSTIGAGQVVVQGASAGDMTSRWTTGELTVGDVRSAASLNILEDGAVSSGTTYIGKQTSPGTISLIGRGGDALTTWNSSGNVYVGGSDTAAGGDGELTIASESQADIAGTLKVWNSGSVELNQGALNAAIINHTDGGDFNFLSGTLQFDLFEGDLTNQGGYLAPGPGAASMEIDGDYVQQAASVLDIEIGGLVAGSSHDDVFVDGAVFLGGSLELSIINGFRPEASQSFDVFGARNIAGSFTNVANGDRLTTTDGSGSFLVHYGADSAFNPTQIFLTDYEIATSLFGDANVNGTVNNDDIPDFVTALLNLADWQTLHPGLDPLDYLDGDMNSMVNNDDIPSFVATLLNPPFLTRSSSAVPEPSSMILVFASLLIATATYSKRTRNNEAQVCPPIQTKETPTC